MHVQPPCFCASAERQRGGLLAIGIVSAGAPLELQSARIEGCGTTLPDIPKRTNDFQQVVTISYEHMDAQQAYDQAIGRYPV
jgi:hypothetical protein